jgi:hypothetical protein
MPQRLVVEAASCSRKLSEFRFDLTSKRQLKELRLDRKSVLPLLKKISGRT